MYKSPIELIQKMHTELESAIEKEVFRAITKVGVNVDKEDLIRALKYDREQYEKGFQDGINFVTDRLYQSANKWELVCEREASEDEVDDFVRKMRNIQNKYKY